DVLWHRRHGRARRRHVEPKDRRKADGRDRHPVRALQCDPTPAGRARRLGLRAAPRHRHRGHVSPDDSHRPGTTEGGNRYWQGGVGDLGTAYCRPVNAPPAPRAPREPSSRTVHGDTVIDEYAWMAGRDDPRLAAYLEAENAYTAELTAHVEPMVGQIFDEIKARTKETDLSVPVRHGRWWYYAGTGEGLQYGIAGRVDAATYPERPVLPSDGPPVGEQLVLDENVEA